VASFLLLLIKKVEAISMDKVLISFREWLHSYNFEVHGVSQKILLFSSLSESGFIPTQNLLSRIMTRYQMVLISFREWLHSYKSILKGLKKAVNQMFSSLSESGFIPTV